MLKVVISLLVLVLFNACRATPKPHPVDAPAPLQSVHAPVDHLISPPIALLPVTDIHSVQTVSKNDTELERLLLQLRSENAALRTCAATDLGSLRRNHQDLIPPLVYALKHDNSKWVRRAAAKSLGKLGSKAAIAPLTEALNDRDRWVAHSAANALKILRG